MRSEPTILTFSSSLAATGAAGATTSATGWFAASAPRSRSIRSSDRSTVAGSGIGSSASGSGCVACASKNWFSASAPASTSDTVTGAAAMPSSEDRSSSKETSGSASSAAAGAGSSSASADGRSGGSSIGAVGATGAAASGIGEDTVGSPPVRRRASAFTAAAERPASRRAAMSATQADNCVSTQFVNSSRAGSAGWWSASCVL